MRGLSSRPWRAAHLPILAVRGVLLVVALALAACDLFGPSPEGLEGNLLRYGEDASATAVASTGDGELVLAGRTEVNETREHATVALLVKTTSEGEEKWHRTFQFGSRGEATDLVITTAGKIVLTGAVETSSESGEGSSIDDDVFLLQTDSQGRKLWSTRRDVGGEDNAHAVIQDRTGGYVIVGSTRQRSDPEQRHLLILKYSPGGEHQWTKTVADTVDTEARDVAETEDGYVITGSQDGEILLVKVSRRGEPAWRTPLAPYRRGEGSSIVVESDGYVVGATQILEGQEFNKQGALIKTDKQGERVWSKDGKLGSRVNQVIRAEASEYVFAGRRIPGLGSFSGLQGGYLARYVREGTPEADSLYDEVFTDSRHGGDITVEGIAPVGDLKVAVAGEHDSREEGSAIYLAIVERQKIGRD